MAITKMIVLMTAKTAHIIFNTVDAMTYNTRRQQRWEMIFNTVDPMTCNNTGQNNGGYNIQHRICDGLSLAGYHVL